MGYLLRTNTGNKDLAKKFERTVLTCVGRDGSETAVCLRRFFVRFRFLASENDLYELVSTFCHVAPDFKALCVVRDWSEKKRHTFSLVIKICLAEVRHN